MGGGAGIDTVKLILSFVDFRQRGNAMLALSTRTTIADIYECFIQSWVMGGKSWIRKIIPDWGLGNYRADAAEFLFNSTALLPN